MAQTSINSVWLCDDDDDDHFVFAEALGHVVPDARLSTFSNGSELLHRLQNEKPDILFLDINMPLVNGAEALKLIREQESLNDLAIVMYSVSEQAIDINTSYQNGAFLYLVKPQLFQDLVKQLQAIFTLDWKENGNFSLLHFNGKRFVPNSPGLEKTSE